MYDLAIIGGGPGGVAAGVYAARKRLKTLFLAKEWGGQSLVSPEIQNWVGTAAVSGFQFAEMLKRHLKTYAADVVDIKEGEEVKNISGIQSALSKNEKEKAEKGFEIRTNAGAYQAKTVLIAAGSRRRKLAVPGAERFEHRGVTYCASCDGPLFAGLSAAVIGGGNAGFETAAQLLAYCKDVTLFNRGETFKADPITAARVLAHPKMKAVLNAAILEVIGEKAVEGLRYQVKNESESKIAPVAGIFVEIGSVPSTEFARGAVKMDEWNQIIVDPRNQRTGTPGIWAAGDCTDGLYHQNNIAAGDAVKALEDIYLYLHAK